MNFVKARPRYQLRGMPNEEAGSAARFIRITAFAPTTDAGGIFLGSRFGIWLFLLSWGPLSGCPHSKSPIIWGLLQGPDFWKFPYTLEPKAGIISILGALGFLAQN